jgi:hypothetical protein
LFDSLLWQVFIPQYSLALEYQGETHYFSSHIFGKASDRKQVDQIKRKYAEQIGVTLISIPFWWDKSPHSLASTIHLHRPDINFNKAQLHIPPIPTEMPLTLQNRFRHIPNSAKEYQDQVDPTGW